MNRVVAASGLVLLLVGAVPAQSQSTTSTLSVDRPLHFRAPDGSDAVVQPGTYEVRQASETTLSLKGLTEGPSLVVDAQAMTHGESLDSPLVLSIPGQEEAGVHYVVLLLPGGKGLEAAGSYTLTRPRGGTTTIPRVSRDAMQRTISMIRQRPAQLPRVTPGTPPATANTLQLPLEMSLETAPGSREELNLLTYNVYMRPTAMFANGQSARAALLPSQLQGYDAIIFNEAFDDDARAELLSRLSAYPYRTSILGTDRGLEQDGGVLLISRWPIESQAQHLFGGGDMCSGWDCWSDKGVLYAKISKNGHPFHIFATHTQAGRDVAMVAIRTRQIQVIRDFIAALNIPSTEPVIIGGDLNVAKSIGTPSPEYKEMLQILHAADSAGPGAPALQEMSPPYELGHCTYCYGINDLASDKEDGMNVLDYILLSATHLPPTAMHAEIRRPLSPIPWGLGRHRDLSDHFPLFARLQFDFQPAPPPSLPFDYKACDPLIFVPAPDAPGQKISQTWGDSGFLERDRIQVTLKEKVLERPGHFDVHTREGRPAFAIEAQGADASFAMAPSSPYQRPRYDQSSVSQTGVSSPVAPRGQVFKPNVGRIGVPEAEAPLKADASLAVEKAASQVSQDTHEKWGAAADERMMDNRALGISLDRGVRVEVYMLCDERLSPRVYGLRYLRVDESGELLTDVMLKHSQPTPR